MKLFLQIVFFLLTWFNLSATPPCAKVALPNYAFSFPKAENQNQEIEVKIGVSNFGRSGISENSFSQKVIFGESYILKKTRTHAGVQGVNGAGKFASHVDIQASLNTILSLKSGNKLTKPIGSASDIELAAIHRYTENGGVLNTPMRNGSETVLGSVTFTQFEAQVYQHTISGLVKLRQTNRLVTSTVIRGRTYSLADYNVLFNSGSTNVPLKGMVSCTKNEAVAIDFLTTSGASVSGPKVKVIMKIKSKNGVDIDDMSDWGVNMVNQKHPGALIQEEVLMEEGMFKMIGQPKPYLENGIPKIEMTPDGPIEWKIIELEETGTALRTIN